MAVVLAPLVQAARAGGTGAERAADAKEGRASKLSSCAHVGLGRGTHSLSSGLRCRGDRLLLSGEKTARCIVFSGYFDVAKVRDEEGERERSERTSYARGNDRRDWTGADDRGSSSSTQQENSRTPSYSDSPHGRQERYEVRQEQGERLRSDQGSYGRGNDRRDWNVSNNRSFSSSTERESYRTSFNSNSGHGHQERYEPKISSGKNKNSSRAVVTSSRMITPRQRNFVPDRTVHRAPWEQRQSQNSEGDFSRNLLIEKLSRRLKEEESESEDDEEDDGNSDNQRVKRGYFDGRSEKSAMSRIVDRLSSIRSSEKVLPKKRTTTGEEQAFLPKYSRAMFPSLNNRGMSTPDNPVPIAGSFEPSKLLPDTRFPWEREEDVAKDEIGERGKRVKPPSLAELTIPEEDLRRLRSLGIVQRHRLKIGKAGVTSNVIDAIHNEWNNSEIVRIKCEGLPAMNMKKTQALLEERTGGLVIWRAGGAALIYRGKNYVHPALREPEEAEEVEDGSGENVETGAADMAIEPNNETGQPTKKRVVPTVSNVYDPEVEEEVEELLSSLGPRYEDWNGDKPIPVDADLLLSSDIEFKKPYRLLPYGTRANLSNKEMTDLRKLSRPIPPHFVLGRNRGLAGLAAAIVKLWEKSEIVKIAVKRGVQNTNHERMSEEIKRLTGGVLLARDKFYMILYRGKDFLPSAVAAALEERHNSSNRLQEEEEKVRFLARNSVIQTEVPAVLNSTAGTLAETLEAKANWDKVRDSTEELKRREEAQLSSKKELMRRMESKLQLTLARKKKAETELVKVQKRLEPARRQADSEHITEEEKYMYRKLGLKMKAFLLLGRRGVFDGTVENMHLHWKHRELVKVIYKARSKVELEQTAKMLEYESGGILVATIPTSKGHAVIIYRGKNYERPPTLRPRTLLTKRQALKQSIEMQRHQALEKHMLTLEKDIGAMRESLEKLGVEIGSRKQDWDTARKDISKEKCAPDEDVGESFEEEDVVGSCDDEEEMEESFEPRAEVYDEIKDGKLTKNENIDPIFRAGLLTRKERLVLRQQALTDRKATAHFNIGKSNHVAGLSKAIRIHFKKHALVKVGVKGRAVGTPVEELVHLLEESTGAVLVSQEPSKLIFYRGWPEGKERPAGNGAEIEEALSHELKSAIIAEDEDYEDKEDENGIYDEGSDDESEILKAELVAEDEDDFEDEYDIYDEGSDYETLKAGLVADREVEKDIEDVNDYEEDDQNYIYDEEKEEEGSDDEAKTLAAGVLAADEEDSEDDGDEEVYFKEHLVKQNYS